uniref:Innexin n=1 Tax=Globodera rostochiensis TaxID=31243 RepID=A0A914HIN2_GLORO
MTRMVFSEVVGTMSFLRPQCDDDSVDRLHYYYTTTFLLVFAVLISLKMFGGSPIECWLPAEFKPSWQEYTDEEGPPSLGMSTYFVPQHNAIRRSDGTNHSEWTSYYQWTPFFLVLSAFCFYSPCLLWRKLASKSGLVLSEIVAIAKTVDQSPTVQSANLRTAKLQGISTHLTSAFRHRLKWHNAFGNMQFCERWELNESIRYHEAYLAILYMSIKMLFISIVFLQACTMNRFLQTDDYDFYGWGVFRDLLEGRAWSDSGNFPRVTFCDIDVRILGTVQRYTVQCILVINIFMEKVYLLLWLWYSLLLLITVFNTFGWLFALFPFSARKEFIVRHLQMADVKFKADKFGNKIIDKFVRNFLKIDGCFVLRMVDMHTTEWVCAEIVDAIWENFVREAAQKDLATRDVQEEKRTARKKLALLEPLVARHLGKVGWSSLPNLRTIREAFATETSPNAHTQNSIFDDKAKQMPLVQSVHTAASKCSVTFPPFCLEFCGPPLLLPGGANACPPSSSGLKTIEGRVVCCGYPTPIADHTPDGKRSDRRGQRGKYCGPYLVVDNIPRCPESHPYDESKRGKDRCCGNKPITQQQRDEDVKRISNETTNCADLAAPGRTTDCPANKHRCEDPLWKDLMTEQCPKTCGRCAEKAQTYGQQRGNLAVCRDGIGPNGESECPANKDRCTDTIWKEFMERECPKTCGICWESGEKGTTRRRRTAATAPTQTTTTLRP